MFAKDKLFYNFGELCAVLAWKQRKSLTSTQGHESVNSKKRYWHKRSSNLNCVICFIFLARSLSTANIMRVRSSVCFLQVIMVTLSNYKPKVKLVGLFSKDRRSIHSHAFPRRTKT